MRGYAETIQKATGCKAEEVAEVENIMRDVVFHSTLDWQSKAVLTQGAKQAYAVLLEMRKGEQ